MTSHAHGIGQPTHRIDGPLKVSGAAKYATEYATPGLLYGVVVSSAIARGRITAIDDTAARALPGVVDVLTHANRPHTALFDLSYKDMIAPPGDPFRALYDDRIRFGDQPVALVVADRFETARDAAALVRVRYDVEPHATDLQIERARAYEPPTRRNLVPGPPKPRGDADRAFAAAAVQVDAEYHVAGEHHNPMELFGTTVVWEGKGRLTIYDKTQGSQNVQLYVSNVFGFRLRNVRVVNSYVGGAFGAGLRPQHSVFLAVLAAKHLERSVRVTLTREQMFTLGSRPETYQRVALGADADGTLRAVKHHATAGTSRHEDHQEVVVNWSGLLYRCADVTLSYELAKLDSCSPTDMRAPGAALGIHALETAMDELSYAAGIDPVALRLVNYVEHDQNDDVPITSKALRSCYAEGAERFGWSQRSAAPRSMHEGRELVGWGMATGAWDAQMALLARARVMMRPDGTVEVAAAATDIGTGTYTIMAQVAADVLGVPIDAVVVSLGDSKLPYTLPQGGSWTAASTSAAVHAACEKLQSKLLKAARGIDGSPVAKLKREQVRFVDGRIEPVAAPGTGYALDEIVRIAGPDGIAATATVTPDFLGQRKHVSYTHSAVFAEVRVDEELGVIRVTRVVSAIAAGRIINPITARSQVLGAVVMGIGQALHEEAVFDHRLGRIMNHTFAEYHVPVNADVHDIDVIFVEEHDDQVSPLGVKGVGEIGIVGVSAAIGNAVFHATGRRVRSLPITIDQLL